MIDVERTIISQYANSPTLCALVQGMNEWIDPRANIQAFYDYVWNVQTAQGFGLDIWGKIVGVGRELAIDAELEYFGFSEGADYQPFDQAPFWDGEQATSTFRLGDTDYRQLILAKALATICRMTGPAINKLLSNLFGQRGRCYVNDMGYMRQRYTFEFVLEPYERSIVRNSGVLPHGAGVESYHLEYAPGQVFGFSEMGADAAPFERGSFID